MEVPSRDSEEDAMGQVHTDIQTGLVAAINKHYKPLQEREPRYSVCINEEAWLVKGAVVPDVLIRDRRDIVEIFEIETGGVWKTLLGGCVAADYGVSIENPGKRPRLWLVVPDGTTTEAIRQHELRATWARGYCKNISIQEVMTVTDCLKKIEAWTIDELARMKESEPKRDIFGR